jgi:prepilin-type N-terminal cleavage/methylation domain-containing protein
MGSRTAVKSGFSLVEMVVVMAIMVTITGALFELMNPSYGLFQTQPEASDLQQRVRVATDTLFKDLVAAGAGTGGYFPAVMPFRRGADAPDLPGSFFEDRVSVLHVPLLAAKTTVRTATEGNAVLVHEQPGCSNGHPLCGFESDGLAVIFDESGAFDTFRITAVEESPPALAHAGSTLSKSYAPGAAVASVMASTYWLQTDQASGVPQLMKYDGNRTDLPLVDDVLGLRFEYFGITEALGHARLTDGPWLPDPSFPGRYDADLLHVRRIRVTLHVQPMRLFHGAPPLDQEIRFDVTPRNLGLVR